MKKGFFAKIGSFEISVILYPESLYGDDLRTGTKRQGKSKAKSRQAGGQVLWGIDPLSSLRVYIHNVGYY